MAAAFSDKGEPLLTAYLIPVSAIGLWPTPNLANPETRSWLAPFSFVLQLITTAVFVARLWARWTKRAGTFGWDDALIIGSWIFGTLFTALVIWGVSDKGFDRHIWDQDPKITATGGLIGVLAEIAYLISTSFTKVSILLFYRRLVDRSYSKWLQWSIYAAIGFTIAYLLAFVIFLITFCSPIEASWKSLDLTYTKKYTCADRLVVDIMVGVLSAFSDAYAIVLPEIVVSQLQMPKKQKIVLYVIFGAGSLVVVAALIRTGWFVWLHKDPRRDLTWTAFDILVWTNLEMQLAIICACAPALRGFFSSYFKGFRGQASYGSGGSSGMGSSVGSASKNFPREKNRDSYGSEVHIVAIKPKADIPSSRLGGDSKATWVQGKEASGRGASPRPSTPPKDKKSKSKSRSRSRSRTPNEGFPAGGIMRTQTIEVDVASIKTTKSMENLERDLMRHERSYMDFD